MNTNKNTKETSIVNYSPNNNLKIDLESKMDAMIATNQKIQDGLAKETAGTGRPIAELKGMPKTLAQISNIGGGSKANGGGGVEEGIKVLLDNNFYQRILMTINMSKQNKKF